MKKSNFFSLLIGAGIGSAITWLFTSAKGKELQRKVKFEAEQLLKNKRNQSSSNPH